MSTHVRSSIYVKPLLVASYDHAKGEQWYQFLCQKQRILHECSLHIIFMKRVQYNHMTRALASVIFIIVNEFHKKPYVMSTNVRFFLSHNTFKSFKSYLSSASAQRRLFPVCNRVIIGKQKPILHQCIMRFPELCYCTPGLQGM